MLRTLFIIIVMSFGIAAAFFSRFAALLLYMWFALFRPQEWVYVDLASLHLSLVLGILLVLPSLATATFPNLTHPISIGMVLFLLSSLVSQIGAVNPGVGWEWLDAFSRLILVSLLATTLIDSRRRFVLVMTTIAVSIGFYSTKAGLGSLMGGGVRFYEGQAGSFTDNNGYALGMAMTLPFLWYAGQALSREYPAYKWIPRAFFLAVPLSAFAIVSTFSRAGLLALVAATLTYVMLQKRRALTFTVLVLLLAVTLPFVPIPKGYFERVETIQTYEEVQDDSALGRLHFWQVAVRMVQAKPLGVGLGNFNSAYDQYDFSNGRYGTHRAVHSSHFQVLAENGYAGAAIWIGLFVYSAYLLFRIRRRAKAAAITDDERFFVVASANALLVSIVAFLVGGAFIALSMNDLTWYSFALVAALDRLSLSHAVSEAPQRQLSSATASFASAARIPEPRPSSAHAFHSRSSRSF
jgi:probable O-glycosylation ligase (exosortase A-associated)